MAPAGPDTLLAVGWTGREVKGRPNDAYLLLMRGDGTLCWAGTLGEPDRDDRAVSATAMPDGTVAVTGTLRSLGARPGGDAFVLRDRFTSESPPRFLKTHPTSSHVLVGVRADEVTSQLRSSSVPLRSRAVKVDVRKLAANLRGVPSD